MTFSDSSLKINWIHIYLKYDQSLEMEKLLWSLLEYTDVWILPFSWKLGANMKVIIILLTTFALVATLSLAQSTPPTLDPASLTSICSEEKSFTCPMSNERYVEYVMPMDRSTETDRCPRRPQKIKKLVDNNKMILPSQNRACHSSVVMITSWFF